MGGIQGCQSGLVAAEVVVTPPRISAGESVHVQVTLSLAGGAHWNNEVEPLRLWVRPAEGWTALPPYAVCVSPDAPTSDEPRSLEFEASAPEDAPDGLVRLSCYALYYLCEDAEGICSYLRLDIPVQVEVSGAAVKLKN